MTTDKSTDNQPAVSPNVLDLFRDSVKPDGTVDKRSTYGRNIRAVQEALDSDEKEAAIAFLKRDIAIFATIERAVECYLLANPECIINPEGLNPLFMNDFMKVQAAKQKALRALIELKKRRGKGGKGTKGRDLSEISFD